MHRRSSSLRIIVTGLIGQHPLLGGVTWDYLRYPLGLALMGHDVYYIEDSGEWPYNLDGGPSGRDWVARDCAPNVRHLASVMSRFGLEDRWAYRFALDGTWFGLPDSARQEIIESADLLLNVSGTLERPEEYGKIPRLAYIDSDPVFTQIKWLRNRHGFRQRIELHNVHFSFGERIAQSGLITGHRWRPTRQPVVLSEWNARASHGERYTTVMSWTSYKPVVHAGRTFAQKDAELMKFLDLPTRVAPAALEIALGGADHLDWQTTGVKPDGWDTCKRPRDLLTQHGWGVVDGIETCSGLDRYREYIQSSKAEWTVAKHGYVAGQPGWFSCRSACYLAAGRPTIVEETGLQGLFPVGEGLLSFETVEEAAAAIVDVEGHYARHAKAAREIAAAYFDAGQVLGRLVEEALAPPLAKIASAE